LQLNGDGTNREQTGKFESKFQTVLAPLRGNGKRNDLPLISSSKWKRNVALFMVGQGITLFGSSLVYFAVMWHITLEIEWLLLGTGGFIVLMGIRIFFDKTLIKAGSVVQRADDEFDSDNDAQV